MLDIHEQSIIQSVKQMAKMKTEEQIQELIATGKARTIDNPETRYLSEGDVIFCSMAKYHELIGHCYRNMICSVWGFSYYKGFWIVCDSNVDGMLLITDNKLCESYKNRFEELEVGIRD